MEIDFVCWQFSALVFLSWFLVLMLCVIYTSWLNNYQQLLIRKCREQLKPCHFPSCVPLMFRQRIHFVSRRPTATVRSINCPEFQTTVVKSDSGNVFRQWPLTAHGSRPACRTSQRSSAARGIFAVHDRRKACCRSTTYNLVTLNIKLVYEKWAKGLSCQHAADELIKCIPLRSVYIRGATLDILHELRLNLRFR